MKQFIISKVDDFKGWNYINALEDFTFPWRKEKAPKTLFKGYYDNEYIYFQFVSYGLIKPIVYVDSNNKLEVTKSERVEIFFRSNEEMNPYYCLEMDPSGRVLDYKAEMYRKFERSWKWPESLSIKTEIYKNYYTLEGKVSLSTLKELRLLKKNEIEIGLYRGHCVGLTNDIANIKWISWVVPKSKTPDFHISSSFGLLKLK